ncbi:hypothetical protein ALC57_04929 [Trachymyrmex cornetzi]|uniref:CCHC-type domain-containing protein n=1 Tax=Trachymyrmex cornetzi TaxID=471704 RepID=A0A151JCB5_9HYME|nr:hypothetical protein ALC57_04929 [Trachymyrmex cornetzi]
MLTHPKIKEAGLQAFISAFNVLSKGVIRNVPSDISESDVMNFFSSPCKILSTKRLSFRSHKDGEIVTFPSRTVLGALLLLSRAITFLHVNFPVSPYFPRVLMCFSCLRYGHVSADCKSKARCPRCGNNKHAIPEECTRLQLPPLCCNCGGEHLPSSTTCPSYIKQKQIYAIAATENISYHEACHRQVSSSPSPSSFSSPNIFHSSAFPFLSTSPKSNRNRTTKSNRNHTPVEYRDLLAAGPGHGPQVRFSPDLPGRSYSSSKTTSSPSPHNEQSRSSPPYSTVTHEQYNEAHSNRTMPGSRYATDPRGPLREVHESLLLAPNGRSPNIYPLGFGYPPPPPPPLPLPRSLPLLRPLP